MITIIITIIMGFVVVFSCLVDFFLIGDFIPKYQYPVFIGYYVLLSYIVQRYKAGRIINGVLSFLSSWCCLYYLVESSVLKEGARRGEILPMHFFWDKTMPELIVKILIISIVCHFVKTMREYMFCKIPFWKYFIYKERKNQQRKEEQFWENGGWTSGNDSDWQRNDYRDYTGFDNAQRTSDSEYEKARVVFGLKEGYTKKELKKVYYGLMKKVHPDENGSTEESQKINACYEILKRYAA